MTTLQQAIANLQRTEANSGYPDVDHFCQALDFFPMGWNETFSARCKTYWLERWMCTDTMVGTAVVYVDDTPVALFVQTARKNTPHIRFIGEEGAEEGVQRSQRQKSRNGRRNRLGADSV